MGRMIVTNALIITMTDRKTINGYVRVGAGAITEIGVGSPPEIKSDEQVVDASGCALMPGLVNAHTHLYQVLLRAVWEDLELMPWLKRIYGCARVLTPEHFYTGSLLGCVEAIRSGVTTVCEHNFLNPSGERAGNNRALQDAIARGIRAHDHGLWRDCADCNRKA
jgi:5-methylthioadenosine/S-adenosylhomocysteine deaminase